jgi:hypothetical protein
MLMCLHAVAMQNGLCDDSSESWPGPLQHSTDKSAEAGGGLQVRLAVPDAWGYTLHEPRGVCVAILPCSESALQAGHLHRLAGFVLGSSKDA